jgi:hypothetical protein
MDVGGDAESYGFQHSSGDRALILAAEPERDQIRSIGARLGTTLDGDCWLGLAAGRSRHPCDISSTKSFMLLPSVRQWPQLPG